MPALLVLLLFAPAELVEAWRPAFDSREVSVLLTVDRRDDSSWVTEPHPEVRLTRQVRTTGDRRAVEFEAAWPDGWHEDTSDRAGYRLSVRVTPVLDGRDSSDVVLLWWLATWLRNSDGGLPEPAVLGTLQFIRLGRPFEGPGMVYRPLIALPGGKSRRGEVLNFIRCVVAIRRPPVEAPQP